MESSFGTDSFELREYLRVLRNRKWTIIAVVAMVLGSAMASSFRQTPMYSATARLLVKGVPTDASGSIAAPNLDTEAEIVTSEPVAVRVIEQLDLDTTSQALISGLAVEPATETGEVLHLTYQSPVASTARDVPNTFAEEYTEYKAEQATASLERGSTAITDQIEDVQDRLATLSRRIESPSVQASPSLLAALDTQHNTMIARLGILQQRLDDFESRRPSDVSGGQLIQSASLPSSPFSPNHLANGVRALFLGLGLGVALGFLRERLDDRVRSRQDLERAVRLPVLAMIPRFPTSTKSGPELVTISQPRGSASEAYRSLRTGVNFLSGQHKLRSVLVTSPSESEGKTVTCVNLAVAFAQSGRRVILISADLRRPTIEEYFGLSSNEGLTTWLIAEDREPWALIRDPGIDSLRVIPSGPIPPNPAELLASPRLTQLLDLLESNCDIVLVDSPPVLAVADAAILSTHVDGTILVVDASKTNRSAAVQAMQELQRVGASLIGAVYNGFDISDSPYAQSYYGRPPPPVLADQPDAQTAVPEVRRSRLDFRR